METSAKTAINVNELFVAIGSWLLSFFLSKKKKKKLKKKKKKKKKKTKRHHPAKKLPKTPPRPPSQRITLTPIDDPSKKGIHLRFAIAVFLSRLSYSSSFRFQRSTTKATLRLLNTNPSLFLSLHPRQTFQPFTPLHLLRHVRSLYQKPTIRFHSLRKEKQRKQKKTKQSVLQALFSHSRIAPTNNVQPPLPIETSFTSSSPFHFSYHFCGVITLSPQSPYLTHLVFSLLIFWSWSSPQIKKKKKPNHHPNNEHQLKHTTNFYQFNSLHGVVSSSETSTRSTRTPVALVDNMTCFLKVIRVVSL